MPRLPGPEALGQAPNLRPTGGAPRVSNIDFGDQLLANGLKNLAAAFDDIETGNQNQADEVDLARAQSTMTTRLLELNRSLENDPDYDTYGERYAQGAAAAQAEAASGIRNRRILDRWTPRADLEIARGLDHILGRANGLRRDAQATELNTILGDLGQAYIQAPADDGEPGNDPAYNDTARAIIRRNMEEQIALAGRIVSPRQLQQLQEQLQGLDEADARALAQREGPLAVWQELTGANGRATQPDSGQVSDRGLGYIRRFLPPLGQAASPQARAQADTELREQAGRMSALITENLTLEDGTTVPLTQLQRDALVGIGVRRGEEALREMMPSVRAGNWQVAGQVGRTIAGGGSLTTMEQPAPTGAGGQQGQGPPQPARPGAETYEAWVQRIGATRLNDPAQRAEMRAEFDAAHERGDVVPGSRARDYLNYYEQNGQGQAGQGQGQQGNAGGRRPPRFSADVDSAIVAAAQASGLDVNIMRQIAQIESGGDPRNVTGSYRGLFQLSQQEFANGGGGNIFDPADNANAAARQLTRLMQQFQAQNGRPATAGDLYLMHQQGADGLRQHLANPDRLAWESMFATGEGQQRGRNWARLAISGNLPPQVLARFGGVDNVTSQQFMDYWRGRVEQGPQNRFGSNVTAQANTGTTTDAGTGGRSAPQPSTPGPDSVAEELGDMLTNRAPSSRFANMPAERRRILQRQLETQMRPDLQNDINRSIALMEGNQEPPRDAQGLTALDRATGILTEHGLARARIRWEAAAARQQALAGVNEMSDVDLEHYGANLPAGTHPSVARYIEQLIATRRRDPAAADSGTIGRGFIRTEQYTTDAEGNERPIGERDTDVRRRVAPEIARVNEELRRGNPNVVVSMDADGNFTVAPRQQPADLASGQDANGNPVFTPEARQVLAQQAQATQETWNRIIDARLAAQARRGVPEDQRRPITEAEARQLLNMLPASRMTQEEFTRRLGSAIDRAVARYGDRAESVLAAAFLFQNMSEQRLLQVQGAITGTGSALATARANMAARLAMGGQLSPNELQNFQTLQNLAAQEQAWGGSGGMNWQTAMRPGVGWNAAVPPGMLGRGGSTAGFRQNAAEQGATSNMFNFLAPVGPDAQGLSNVGDNAPPVWRNPTLGLSANQPGSGQGTGAQQQYPEPSPEQRAWLSANISQRWQAFEDRFGPGSAYRYLSEQEEQPRPRRRPVEAPPLPPQR